MTASSVPPPCREGRELVGRSAELDELGALLRGGSPFAYRFVVIEGPWGAGKTALLRAVCAQVEGDATVVWGRGRHAERDLPLGVLREALWPLLADPCAGDADTAARARAVLHDAAARPSEVADALACFLSRRAGRLVIAIDSADKADAESVLVAAMLVRRARPGQALLVVTSAAYVPGAGIRTVDGLAAEPECRVVTIGPLAREAVHAFVTATLPGGGHLAADLWEVSGGRPLFLFPLVESLGRRLTLDGDRRGAEDARSSAPVVVRSALLTRLALLPPATSDLLRAVAALGGGSDLPFVASLAGIDADDAATAVDAAVAWELLGPGELLGFTVPLLRSAVLQTMSPPARQRLHAGAARALTAQGAGPDDIAPHLLAAAPVADPEIATLLWRHGQEALRTGELARARQFLQRALQEPPDPEEVGDVLLDLVAAELGAGQREAVGHFRRAAMSCRYDDSAAAARAAALLRRFPDAWADPVIRAVAEKLASELRASDVGAGAELEVVIALASGVWHAADLAGLQQLADATEHVVPGVAREARVLAAVERLRGVDPTAADDLGRLLVEVVVEQREGERIDHRLLDAARAALVLHGRLAPHDLPPRGGTGRESAGAGAVRAVALLRAGELEAAEVAAQLVTASTTGVAAALWLASATLLDVLVLQGRLEEAARLSVVPVPGGGGLGGLFDVVGALALGDSRARLLAAAGRHGPALACATANGRLADANGIDNPALTSWRRAAGVAAHRLGLDAQARRLLGAEVDRARVLAAPGPLASALRAWSELGPDQASAGVLGEALALASATTDRLLTSQVRADYGRALVAAGDPGGARRELRTAAHEAAVCGAHALAGQATEQLRSAGGRPRRLVLTGWAALTPTEARVARLAAVGQSNRGIAVTLFVSEKTVEGHLAHVFRKLGIRSRHLLAARAPGDRVDGPSPAGREAPAVSAEAPAGAGAAR